MNTKSYTTREVFLTPEDLRRAVKRYIESFDLNVVFSDQYTITFGIQGGKPIADLVNCDVKIIFSGS